MSQKKDDLSRRDFLKAAGRGLAAAGAASLPLAACHPRPPRHGSPSRPNILLFFSDQERYPWHLEAPGGGGRPGLRTPNRDSLRSAGGVELRRHFATSSICSPSRGTMLTGLYPHQHGILDNIDAQEALSPAVRTVGHRVGEAGYRVGYRGKWHLSKLEACSGTSALSPYGFEDFRCAPLGKESHLALHNDAANTAWAADWIRAREGESDPWFLVVSLVNPHDLFWPMLYPRREWEGRYDLAGPDNLESLERLEAEKPAPQAETLRSYSRFGRFYSDRGFSEYTLEDWRIYNSFYAYLIEGMDRELGRVLAAVRETDPDLENTVIIITSDHGDTGGAHGLPYKGPWMYKENLNVPMVIKAPGSEHRAVDTLTSHIDLVPTICDLAGVEPSGNLALPGVSLRPLLEGSGAAVHPDGGVGGIFAEVDVAWLTRSKGLRTVVADVDGEIWRYTNYNMEEGKSLELYNLTADVRELHNLAETAPRVVSTLESRLRDWVASTPPDPGVRG